MVEAICFGILVLLFYMKLDDINDGIKDMNKSIKEIKDKV